MERRVSQRSGLWFFRILTDSRHSGRTGLFEDGELQALLDIIGVNHGAEHGAEPFGSTEKVNVFSNKPASVQAVTSFLLASKSPGCLDWSTT